MALAAPNIQFMGSPEVELNRAYQQRVEQARQQEAIEARQQQEMYARKQRGLAEMDASVRGQQPQMLPMEEPGIMAQIGKVLFPQGQQQQAPQPQMLPPSGTEPSLTAPAGGFQTKEGYEWYQAQQDKQQKLNDAKAYRVLELFGKPGVQENESLVMKLATSMKDIPGWEPMGAALEEANYGSGKKVIFGAQLKNQTGLGPKELAAIKALPPEMAQTIGPLDQITLKNRGSEYVIDGIKKYASSANNRVVVKPVREGNEIVTYKFYPDGRQEEIGRAPVNRSPKIPYQILENGYVFDKTSGNIFKGTMGQDGKMVRTQAGQEDVILGTASMAEAKESSKVVGKKTGESIGEIPKITRTISKLATLKEQVESGDDKDYNKAFGLTGKVRGALANISTEWESAVGDERSILKTKAANLIPPDLKKMFGPPFSDSDMKIMLNMTGANLSSKAAFLAALDDAISGHQGNLDELQRYSQQAAPTTKGSMVPRNTGGPALIPSSTQTTGPSTKKTADQIIGDFMRTNPKATREQILSSPAYKNALQKYGAK